MGRQYHAHITDIDNERTTEYVKALRPFVGISAADVAISYLNSLLKARRADDRSEVGNHRISIRNLDRDHINITAFGDGDAEHINSRVKINTACECTEADGLGIDEYKKLSEVFHL
jgi:hypothetical protein